MLPSGTELDDLDPGEGRKCSGELPHVGAHAPGRREPQGIDMESDRRGRCHGRWGLFFVASIGRFLPRKNSQGWYAGSVIITGFVGQRTRKTLLEGASVLAYPSLYEEFGFPMLEAMTWGVPVVACDVGPVREVAAGAVRSLIRRMRTRSAWPSSSPSVNKGH